VKVPVKLWLTQTRFEIRDGREVLVTGKSMPEINAGLAALNAKALAERLKGQKTTSIKQYEVTGHPVDGRIRSIKWPEKAEKK
jgi:hypothetical protein